jgi:cobalt-zinc-cadmium efflux system outer membrane protein
LAQASRLHNIELAGSWRIPNRPPSIVDSEYSASADFLDLLTMPARKKIATRNLEQTKLEIADKVLQLAADTQSAFYQLQAQMELVKGLGVVQEVNEASADLAQRQFDAGNISELELHTQEAPAVQVRLERMRAQAEIQMDRERLNRLLGLSGEQLHWQTADELPALPGSELALGDLESLAIRQRLDLAAKKIHLESMLAALRLKKHTRWVPGVNVGVDTERTPDGQRVTGPTLDLEVPIFDQGQAAVAKLGAQWEQAKDEYTALELMVRSEVRGAQAAMASAREAVELAQDHLLPLQKQILGEMLRHYNAMEKSSYDLLLAKEREQMAEQGSIEALRDYWLARVELERAAGGRLTDKTNSDSERSKP